MLLRSVASSVQHLSVAMRSFARNAQKRARFAAAVRPTLDDVERLIQGDRTKRRGIGSRRVPHRLNAEEKMKYEVALRVGYALVDGTGHRRHKDAKGSPLLNILRQRADALARPLVWLERHKSGGFWHACIDYSPVRAVEDVALHTLRMRTQHVLATAPTPCAFVDSPWHAHERNATSDDDRCEGGGADDESSTSQSESETRAGERLGESGDGGEHTAAMPERDEALSSRPIWALPALTERFGFCSDDEAQRKACKRLAEALAREFSERARGRERA